MQAYWPSCSITIRAGDHQRNVCLIPSSAHGTNPASAQMCNMQVVVVKCDDLGNVDLDDLKAKIAANQDKVAAIMITYPSTHGVFEERVTEVCKLVHDAGGQFMLTEQSERAGWTCQARASSVATSLT